jgi:dedicator of cytokinesis protein 3
VFKYTYISKEHQQKSKVNVKNDFSHLWINQVYLFVKNKLPYTKRKEPVISRKEKLISPFMNAVMSIQQKNNEILDIIAQFIASEKRGNADIGPLSMILNGVIDAAVSGGVKKYEEAFIESNYLVVHGEDSGLLVDFQKALGEQLVVLAKGLQLFEQHCGDQLRPLYNHLADLFEKMKIQEERLL